MGIVVSCQCGQRIEAAESAAPQVATCPGCGAEALVPPVRRATAGEWREGAPIRLVMATERVVTRAPRRLPGEVKVCCTSCGKLTVVCAPMPAKDIHCPHCGMPNPVPQLVVASLPDHTPVSLAEDWGDATLVLGARALSALGAQSPGRGSANDREAPATAHPSAPVLPVDPDPGEQVDATDNEPPPLYVPPAEPATGATVRSRSSASVEQELGFASESSSPVVTSSVAPATSSGYDPAANPWLASDSQPAALFDNLPPITFGGELTPVQCGGCGNRFGAGPALAGNTVHCPVCGNPLAIPGHAWGPGATASSGHPMPAASSRPLPPAPPRPRPGRRRRAVSAARSLGGLAGDERNPVATGVYLLHLSLLIQVITALAGLALMIMAYAIFSIGAFDGLLSSLPLLMLVQLGLGLATLVASILGIVGRGFCMALRSDSTAMALVLGSLICNVLVLASTTFFGRIFDGLAAGAPTGAISLGLVFLADYVLLVLFLWRLALLIEEPQLAETAITLLILLACSIGLVFVCQFIAVLVRSIQVGFVFFGIMTIGIMVIGIAMTVMMLQLLSGLHDRLSR